LIKMSFCCNVVLLLVILVVARTTANDPAGSWLSYAAYTVPYKNRITSLSTSWTVPNTPSTSWGSNAPGWWFGIQTAKGDGALIQPILAWGYQGNEYTMFNGCFDWTNGGSWTTSPEKYTVQPGDVLTSSITYKPEDNSYDMFIQSNQTGKSITTNYKLLRNQHANETTAYFVLEHQPDLCSAYPSDGVCTFENIKLEVEGQVIDNVPWKAAQEQPACDSKATIKDPETIEFTWSSSAVGAEQQKIDSSAPLKWGYGDQ
jgi:hypothetical protein